MNRISKAAQTYYDLPDCIPTEENYQLWLGSLSEMPKSLMEKFRNDGFENCQRVLNYRRFILEQQDIGMNEFMKDHLSKDDYEVWKNPK